MSRICIVSPSLNLGGIERALVTLAIEFQSLGFEVCFISCLKDIHFYKLTTGIEIYEPQFRRSKFIFNKIFFYPWLLFFIRKTIININPDRVLVYGDFFSPLTLLALIGTKYSVYISDRTIPHYKFGFPIPQLKQWLYPKSAGFIAQTHYSKDFKLKQFGNKLRIEVIPNALPSISNCYPISVTKENLILYVGRFAWEKDPEILIRSMSLVVKKYPSWGLQMAGTGPLLNSMKELVQQLDLQKNVFFLGKISNVEYLYQSSSFLVLPSIVEGFPNTLIEAMSFGLPPICFKNIPYQDILTNQVEGLIVNERTPLALANAIILLIENENIRNFLSNNSVISVKRFEKSYIAKKFISFMEC